MTIILTSIFTGGIVGQILGLDSGSVFIFAVVLLAVVIYTFFQLRKQVRSAKEKRNEQLRHQFEEGEITKSEYEGKKKELR